jgi:cell division protein FtsQ
MQSLGRVPQRHAPARRDPSPSRWAYRMQRLWLTPVFRVLVRFGLPVLVVGAVAGLVFHDDARRSALAQSLEGLREQFEQRPEFRVSYVSIDGVSSDLADAVRAKLALKLPQSSFDLDLDALRLKAEELDAVQAAELRVRSGGVLQVVLTEREPALVWRNADRLELLDATGHRVAGLGARGDRADLPLVAGEGADAATPEALAILDAAGPIAPRLRGLVRMGDRRWDIVLDRNQRIELPAENPIAALERLLALDQADRLLDRDILTIDLRQEQRPVLRLAPFALSEARRAQGLTTTTGNDL